MSGSVGVTALSVYEMAAITLPTLVEAIAGRLTVAHVDARLAAWGRALVRHADVDLTVEGLANVPRDRACIYMSNHQSHFDVPILYSVFPTTLRMVAKAELFRVPLWGAALRAAGFVRVTRSGNRHDAETAMRECARELARGVNIWIAPEGTRSRDGRLGRFKKGGFLLARGTGADIVPVALDGSRHVLPKDATLVHPGQRVRVAFGAPIAVAGRDTPALMAAVREFIAAHVTSPPG